MQTTAPITAISIWDDQIAPLFDASCRIRIITPCEGGNTTHELDMPTGEIFQKIALLASHKVALLICGAISRCAADVAAQHGIEVEGFLTGHADDVLKAVQQSDSASLQHRMPGCRRKRNRCGRTRSELQQTMTGGMTCQIETEEAPCGHK